MNEKLKRTQYDSAYELNFTNFMMQYLPRVLGQSFKDSKEMVAVYLKVQNQQGVKLDWRRIESQLESIGLKRDAKNYAQKYFQDDIIVHNLDPWPRSQIEDVVRVVRECCAHYSELSYYKLNGRSQYLIMRKQIMKQVADALHLRECVQHPYKSIEDKMRNEVDAFAARQPVAEVKQVQKVGEENASYEKNLDLFKRKFDTKEIFDDEIVDDQ